MIDLPTLTIDEVAYAAFHGLWRRTKKLSGEHADREQTLKRSTWDNEIEGACAELAYCKFRGIYWTGATGLRSVDGGRDEIKWTHHNGGGLILNRSASDGVRYILVDGFAPQYRIVGWMLGREGKRDNYWTRDYFLAPRSDLHKVNLRV